MNELPRTWRAWPPERRLLVLLGAGLLLRAFIAGIYAPQSGFYIDIGDFTAWARELAAHGPGEFYRPNFFADYPPTYLYVLWLLGTVGAGWAALAGGVDITGGLVKIPGILAEFGLAWLVFVTCRRWLGSGGAFAAAAIYLLNPGTIFNSAVWGQVDSVGALAVLATLSLLASGRTELAAVAAVATTLLKFQYGFLLPIVAVVGIKRHVLGRSSDPAHAGRREPLRALLAPAAGMATAAVLMFPFGLAIWLPADPMHSLWHRFLAAADTYKGLTINAFTAWMNPLTNLADPLQWGDDQVVWGLAGGVAITPQLVGVVAFAVAAVLALTAAARRDDLPGILFAGLLLAVAFFVLPTRVHERYLFPALALAAPFAITLLRWRVLYGVLSTLFFFNVYFAYTVYGMNRLPRGDLPLRDEFLGATILSPGGIYLLAFSGVLATLWLAYVALNPSGVTDAGRNAGWLRAALARVATANLEERAASEQAPARGSPPPTGGPARRFGRAEWLLLVAIVLAAFVFRLGRLEAPTAMHFDEVYHARSAAEWLANWQQGANRDVYEWTHPMLAKYLIAAGIVVADPNRVLAERPMDRPAPALAVAPPSTAGGRERALLFAGSDTAELAVRELPSGTEVGRWPLRAPASTLVFDDGSERLVAGSATDGSVTILSLGVALRSAGPIGAPQATVVDSGLGSVSALAVDGQTVYATSPDGTAAIDVATGEVTATSSLGGAGAAFVPAAGEEAAALVVSDPGAGGVHFLDAQTLALPGEGASPAGSVLLAAAPVGPLSLRDSGDELRLFVPIAASPLHGARGGLAIVDPAARTVQATMPLSQRPVAITWHRAADVVYVAGETLLFTVEPHGDGRSGYGVFDTTQLPGRPLAMAVDATDRNPADDHELLTVSTLADDGSGAVALVDAGSNAFAWRLAGIVSGALLAGIVFLLALSLFGSLSLAVLAGVFFVFDGMAFAQSRIAMNDVFVAFFVAAAYLLFWQVWSGRWARAAWWALPAAGVAIGLAAASKWVGFYALAGLLILVLARSDLGRLVLLAGFAFLLVVAGIGAPWPFAAVVLGAVVLLAAIAWRSPPRVSVADVMALPGIGVVVGVVGVAFTLAVGTFDRGDPVGVVAELLTSGAEAGWPVVVLAGTTLALLVARAWASIRRPDSDADWFRPASLGGFAWAWAGACLLAIPILVYGLHYLPYVALGHAWAGLERMGPEYGWSVEELQVQMFGYHFGLEASHAASSPWWSWPLAARPVWFHTHEFDLDRTAVIYNGGNPVLWWAILPAMAAGAWVAWRRGSLAMVLLAVAFACLWLPWTRIERATFQYHFFTALPFALIAVAWLVDTALQSRRWRELAVAYLAAAAIAAILIYPIGSALPMPDWYINAFQSLPPWNYYAQFPDPPAGERTLVSAGIVQLMIGLLAAVAAAAFGLFGAMLWRRQPIEVPRRSP